MSYSDHMERVQRRNDRAMKAAEARWLDPPDDGPSWPECPICQVRDATAYLGDEADPCEVCGAKCVACGAEGVLKVRGGRCLECATRCRLGAKTRRAAGWRYSRPARNRRRRLVALLGWKAAMEADL